MGAASDPHGPLCVPYQPAEGEREAGGKGEDGGAPVFEVHGANGAPTVRQIADGGQAAPWHATVMFVVWNPDRGFFLPVWQPPRWCAPGGARRRCRRVLLAEDIQPCIVGAIPSVGVGGSWHVLGNQPAQPVEREVVGVGFSQWRGCAEGLRPSAKWAGMQPGDALAAELVHPFGAAAAEVMPKERGVEVFDFFPADVARIPRFPPMWAFTSRHPEERYRSWDNQVTLWECARLCAVRCGGWCGCSPLGVAVCQCVLPVVGLRWLVMDEEVVIHTVGVGGLLCFLCVQLDALLQLCICPLDGGELHVTYCGFTPDAQKATAATVL